MNLNNQIIQVELVDIILHHFYRIYNELGYGFLEKVYKNALYFALIDEGIKCEAEKPIQVHFDGRVVGEYRADILVENRLILELKACEDLNPAHEYQLINYLKATQIEVGYLLNFGKKPKYCRKIYTNDRKNII